MNKIAFIGQAPPKTDPARPFGRSQLYKWFAEIGISDEHISRNFYFGSLISYFPGLKGKSHREPSAEEILKEKPALQIHLQNIKPDVIVAIGKLSIANALGLDFKKLKLEEIIGKHFKQDPYGILGKEILIIPFPHPSGASSWYNFPKNRLLLNKALELLKQNL